MAQDSSSGGDVEQRAPSREKRRISRASMATIPDENLDEYGRLVKFVSTYREPGAEEEQEEEGTELRRVWYAPWRKRRVRVRTEADAGKFPDEWLLTDIKQGLSSEEVINRRRRSGWNELVSEKENPIAKFMSYFKGPILYGNTRDIPQRT